MNTFSSRWIEPTKGYCALVALDCNYQWMLPICAFFLRSNLMIDIEAWTWGKNDFHPDVMESCKNLGVSLKYLPDTGQYCAGWEARHHAMCITEYRHVFMLDVDTYVIGRLPWLFQPMNAGMRLRIGDLWENYQNFDFSTFFGLPEQNGGYSNYSVWFGEYDRAHPKCREVLCKTSDLLGFGPEIYQQSGVIGDQDIRNGVLHSVGCPVDLIDIKVNAWESLKNQLEAGYPIVHQTEKALTREAAQRLMQALHPS